MDLLVLKETPRRFVKYYPPPPGQKSPPGCTSLVRCEIASLAGWRFSVLFSPAHVHVSLLPSEVRFTNVEQTLHNYSHMPLNQVADHPLFETDDEVSLPSALFFFLQN